MFTRNERLIILSLFKSFVFVGKWALLMRWNYAKLRESHFCKARGTLRSSWPFVNVWKSIAWKPPIKWLKIKSDGLSHTKAVWMCHPTMPWFHALQRRQKRLPTDKTPWKPVSSFFKNCDIVKLFLKTIFNCCILLRSRYIYYTDNRWCCVCVMRKGRQQKRCCCCYRLVAMPIRAPAW